MGDQVSSAQLLRNEALEIARNRISRTPFINGEFIQSGDGVLEVIDPMTGETILDLDLAGRDEVDLAVGAARRAFDTGVWSDMHPRERSAYLYRLAELIEHSQRDLALLEALDAGKRFTGVSGWDIPNAAEVYRYYGGWSDKLAGSIIYSGPSVEMLRYREPVGVCAAIIPWNFPFPCAAWKMAPALAAGCTVVVKSAERAPLSLQYLAELVRRAGFPPGVVNIVCGTGEGAGRALSADRRVDKITFTGETDTARDILQRSLLRMPRVTFELGDKTPIVIFPDADLDAAVTAAASAAFGVSGQNCCAGSRILVHRSIFAEVADRLRQAAAQRILGDQFAVDTQQGPQIDGAHVARILDFVESAVGEGADILAGGAVFGDRSQFFEPTLLVGAAGDSRINQEEVFGPVATLTPFDDLTDALRIANGRSFGLAASVWSKSFTTCHEMIRGLRCGTVWANTYEYFDSMVPWGGVGASGVGRELGAEGVEGFLETKSVVRSTAF